MALALLVPLLVLCSAFSTAIMVARRVNSVSLAYPLGILSGLVVLALFYGVLVALFSFGLLARPGMPFFTE
ncbi:MAG: hypothetical protein AAF982_09795 [Pseudomonadota bacterium]